jgi:hypothetical protein
MVSKKGSSSPEAMREALRYSFVHLERRGCGDDPILATTRGRDENTAPICGLFRFRPGFLPRILEWKCRYQQYSWLRDLLSTGLNHHTGGQHGGDPNMPHFGKGT